MCSDDFWVEGWWGKIEYPNNYLVEIRVYRKMNWQEILKAKPRIGASLTLISQGRHDLMTRL